MAAYRPGQRAPSVSVTGARNDKDKERILSLLEEIWQDDSWLPAA
nr:DinI-like family protein [Shigella sonnei]